MVWRSRTSSLLSSRCHNNNTIVISSRGMCTTPSSDTGLSSSDVIEPVTMVQDKQMAKKVIQQLMALGPDHIHACDTEVADIDIKSEGPVGNGYVTCLSIYSGPSLDFGNGPRIWVDNLDSATGTLDYMKEFLESKSIKKIWHNYSFDRHVLFNHDINVQGLGGDTMHMARLWNTARFQKGYSLSALSEDLLNSKKTAMKEIFGVAKLKKDGTAGKAKILPSIRDLQRLPETRERWIRYSCFDAECTWHLHEILKQHLEEMHWYKKIDGQDVSMYEFYTEYIVPFGECLTDIERKGMLVDQTAMSHIEILARDDLIMLKERFMTWLHKHRPNITQFNINSASQKQQLLFAPYMNKKKELLLEKEREFLVDNEDGFIEEGKEKPKKMKNMIIEGFGMNSVQNTPKGLPTTGSAVLRELAGLPFETPPRYGLAYNHFNGGKDGREACEALDALCAVASTNTMLNNFILPLQALADENGRVHGSLNLNTDTGRLSSRRPNLQNQPALEKDRYKIRDAFIAPEGKTLIVADYSQLELRLLAHITNCKGMIEAFKAGGDFHSRTAMGMYEYVAASVERGDCLLEWDSSKGAPPVPLLKDLFGTERKNAKILNFSIAYGKTPFGLAKDFNVSREEAAATLEKWYSDRPEVKSWQQSSITTANTFGYTRTLMGRYRMLPDAQLKGKSMAFRKARAHAERASINTPIQGAAADVVMQAMLRIHHDPWLRENGWEIICQIHDEIIAEGPLETSEAARQRVVYLMENPFKEPLSVALDVEAKVDTSWYKAK